VIAKRGRAPFSLWAPVVLYMALIFALSSMPQPPEVPSAIGDKGGHLLLYAGLGGLFVRALAGGWNAPVPLRVALLAIVYSTVYGVTDEMHQAVVPPRQVEALDIAADGAGAAVAAAVLWLRARIRRAGDI
jgi:VanZ family protein